VGEDVAVDREAEFGGEEGEKGGYWWHYGE